MSSSDLSLDSARATVQELCQVDTSQMSSPQLLQVLDDNIAQARRGGDQLATNVLLAVRRGLRAKASSFH
jgi:hypothetical protein